MDDLKTQLSPADQVQRDELVKAFRDVFKTVAGKRVLFWMLEQCAIYREAYQGELTNHTHYTLGLQAGGRKLIDMLNSIDPRIYPQLLFDMAELREIDKAAAASLAVKQEQEDDEE